MPTNGTVAATLCRRAARTTTLPWPAGRAGSVTPNRPVREHAARTQDVDAQRTWTEPRIPMSRPITLTPAKPVASRWNT